MELDDGADTMKQMVNWLLGALSTGCYWLAYRLECLRSGHRWSVVTEEFANCRRCEKYVTGHKAHIVWRELGYGDPDPK